MGFKHVESRQEKKQMHRDMSAAIEPIGGVGLWYGKGKVSYRGNFQIGFTKEAEKYNIVLFEPDERDGSKPYLYSGFISLPNPDNAWEVRQHREHRAYLEETRIGKCYFYKGKNGGLYMLTYLDTGEQYRLCVEENDSDNTKAPVLKGVVFPLQDAGVKDKREEKIERKFVRREVGTGRNEFFKQEPTTASEVIKIIHESPLSDDDYIDIMLGLLTKFGSLTQFKDAATERLSRKETEPQSDEVEVEEFDDDDGLEENDDDDEPEYEVVRPTSVDVPVIVPAMPKERIAEVVKNSEYARPDKVASLDIRLANVSSSLVEGIDEEGDLV